MFVVWQVERRLLQLVISPIEQQLARKSCATDTLLRIAQTIIYLYCLLFFFAIDVEDNIDY